MKKKLMTLAIALGLSLSMLTGCGKPTVESLIDGLYDKEIESQTADVEMEIELSIDAMGYSFDVSADGDYEVQYSVGKKDVVTTYIDGEFAAKIPMGDIDEKVGIEAYSIVDGATITNYTCVDGGEWYMTEIESDDSAGLDQETTAEIMEAMKDVLKENGELAEDTEKVEGEECYVITATIEGRDWSDICKPIQSMLDDAIDDAMDTAMKEAGVSIDIDMNIDILSWVEYCSVDITYYISKDTGYLIKAEMDMSNTDFDSMMKQMIKDLGQELIDLANKLEDEYDGAVGAEEISDAFEEFEEMLDKISISFSKFNISVVYSDINDTEVEVPDDVIDDAIEMNGSDAIGDLMGGIGDDVIEEPPVEPDPIDMGNSSNGSDEWYHGNSFTFNKCDNSDEFLCEVKIPNGWVYDEVYSYPEWGRVSLDRADGNGNGWIYVYNEAYYPTYSGLLNGELDDSDYEDYKIDVTVIGTAFGGSDVMLVRESYTDSGWDYDDTFLCIRYDDGGFAEFLTVKCTNLDDLDAWTEDDFLDLAVSLFGR